MSWFYVSLPLLTAVCWSVAVIMFKKCDQFMSASALNLFKNVLALFVLIPVGWVWGMELGTDAPPGHLVLLFASGAIGIGLADTLFFWAMTLIGAGRVAILDTLYSPLIVLFAFVFLEEMLTGWDAVGATLVILALFLTHVGDVRDEVAPKDLVLGSIVGAFAIVFMAVGIVMVKPILPDYPVLWSSIVRLLGGVVPLWIWMAAWRPESLQRAFVPRHEWRILIPACFVGTALALVLWLAGFKFNPANTTAVLNQTSAFMIIGLSAAFLGERLTLAKVGAVILGFCGSALVIAF